MPNRAWCGDFKGWRRTPDGARIDPLTLSDAGSRYLVRCQAVEKTDTLRVQAIFEADVWGTKSSLGEVGRPLPIDQEHAPRIESRRAQSMSLSPGSRNESDHSTSTERSRGH